MRRMFGFIGIIVGTQFIVSSAIAGTTYVSGIISANTVWDPTGSPYIVTGNVRVDSLVTLDIEPGVEVRIDEDKYIMIKGTLNAIGTVTDSIIISARDTTKRWNNLWFKPASAGSLMYCRIEYADNSAIYDSTASSLYIGYNTISNNSDYVEGGGGIHSFGSATITGNTITGNSAWMGGGIFSYSGSATITGNTITNNSANAEGGGIHSFGSATITGNTITGNSASDEGGGIFSYSGSATITGNTITGNSAYYGGGILSYSGSPTITGNTITGNSATWGGGIHSSDSATITGNTITNNSANLGGGICSNVSPTITGNTITNNSADWGGGIYSDYGSATIKYNTIIDTTASAIYINSDSALIDSNNLYATGYAVYSNTANDINARYNYWGTTDSATIANEKIWDFYDDFEKGIVHYEPFLSEPGVEEKEKLRVESLELRVYPNPSFGNALIKYGVPERANMTLSLYDISGRLVKTLVDGEVGAGSREIAMNLEEFTNGIYFVKMEAGNYKATRKLTIIR